MKLFHHALLRALACVALLAVMPAQALAVNAIEAINVAQQGNDVTLRIDLREALSVPPAGFAVANPAKIAFDFPSTANALGKSAQQINDGDLRSLNIVEVSDRTRLVLNLLRSMNYKTRLDGKSLYVTLSPVMVPGAGQAAGATMRFAEETAVGNAHAIRDVTFRRGKNGEGRIVVDLSDAGTGIDIRQQGSALLVDFVKTALPQHLARKLDVLDFATPVESVETRGQGENVRMTITPKGLWEHNAYQSDNQFVIEVKQVIEDPNKLVQGSKIGYQGPRVSINYQNGDVRALLRLMAEELGLNAVISETVTGFTTLVLKDVPADQVIDIIFQQKGLDMRKKGNIIMIAPRDEIATREKLDFESKQQISELEPLKMEQFALNYQKAVNVARLLNGLSVIATPGTPGATGGAAQSQASNANAAAQRILSKRGSAVADPQSNMLFVHDIPSKLEEINTFIKTIDVGARQVQIEARIVEAQDSFMSDIGMRLNFLSSAVKRLGNSGVGIGAGSYTNPTFTSKTNGSMQSSIAGADGVLTQTFNDQFATSTISAAGAQAASSAMGINLPASSTGAGVFALSLFNPALTNILNLEISALQSDGLGKIISSPRVITANNVKAKIEDGTEIPVVKPAQGNEPATVTFRPAKLSLDVTPQITPEGTIKMAILVKKEDPDWTRSVLGNPPIKSSVVETNVIVENGATLVVGGIYSTSQQNKLEKIPLLGDLPIVGNLFRHQQKDTARREVLIFITPRIVSGLSLKN